MNVLGICNNNKLFIIYQSKFSKKINKLNNIINLYSFTELSYIFNFSKKFKL